MSSSALVNLRRKNKAAVIYKLMSRGEMSRLTLSRELNLTSSTLTHIVKELLEDKKVTEVSKIDTGKRGRREVLLKFDCESFIAIGINIESDNTHLSVASYNSILSEEIIDTKTLFSDGISTLTSKITKLTTDYAEYNLLGICVGVCGNVSADGISIQSFGIFKNNYPLKAELEKALNTSVVVVNNVKAQASSLISEINRNFLFVKHSPGIGCAMVEGGRAVDGFSGIAGELGHTTVVPNGLKCRCGKMGCLEAYSSESSLIEQYYKKTNSLKTISEIYSVYGTDPVATEILDIAINHIALSISNASALLNPERIILTGGIFFEEKLYTKITGKIREFGSDIDISIMPNEYRIKAFAEARYILTQKLFEVKNEKEN